MNYVIIDIVIFLLGCAASFCFIRFGRNKLPTWLQLALGLKLLEGEAAQARARQVLKDSAHKRQ